MSTPLSSTPLSRELPTQLNTQTPVPSVKQPKKLDAIIKDLSVAIKTAKTANNEIKAQIKPLDKAKQNRIKWDGLLLNAQNPQHTRAYAKEVEKFQSTEIKLQDIVEKKQEELNRAKQILEEARLDPRLKVITGQTTEIKKIKELISKLEIEVNRQDEQVIKNIEKQLVKITGNNLFNSIFRIKSIHREDVPQIRALAKELREVQGRSPGLFTHRIQKLENQLGRALLIGHGYRTEKDLDRFLKLNVDSLMLIGLDDTISMSRFIKNKYPDKNVKNLEISIQRKALSNLAQKLDSVEVLNLKERQELESLQVYLKQIKRNDSLYADAQIYKLRIHMKLHPNYFDEVLDFIGREDTSSLDYKSKGIEHRGMLEEYRLLPKFAKRANQLLGMLVIAEKPNFLQEASRDFERFQAMNAQGIKGFENAISLYVKRLEYIRDGSPNHAESNKAYTLLRKFKGLQERGG